MNNKILTIVLATGLFSACGGAGGNNATTNGSVSNPAVKTETKKNSGVSGEKACAVFEKAGLTTSSYKTDEKKELWTCYASKWIGPEGRKAELTYFVSGSETSAEHLEIALDKLLGDSDMPMDKSKEAAAIKLRATYLDALVAGAEDLAKFTTNGDLPSEIKDAIKEMKPATATVGDVKIEVEKKDEAGLGFNLLVHFRY